MMILISPVEWSEGVNCASGEDVVLVHQAGRGGALTRTKTRVNIFVGNGKENPIQLFKFYSN